MAEGTQAENRCCSIRLCLKTQKKAIRSIYSFSQGLEETVMVKKKRSMKQTIKAARKKPPKKEKRAKAPPEKKGIPGITQPQVTGEKLEGQIKRMKVITPHSIASRFNLRLSIARQFIKELERKGKITFVSRSRNIKIYKPAD